MRILIAIFALITAAFAASPSGAQVYPWCAFYNIRGGGTNCYFATLSQCQQAISGNGGVCYQNPLYPAVPTPRRGDRGGR